MQRVRHHQSFYHLRKSDRLHKFDCVGRHRCAHRVARLQVHLGMRETPMSQAPAARPSVAPSPSRDLQARIRSHL